MKRDVRILVGTASLKLGTRILEHLNDAQYASSDEAYTRGTLVVNKFSNDNTFVQIGETVRDADVFIIQSSGFPVNDRLMELLITIDACRRSSAGRISVVMPYFPYSRSDKIDQPRIALTARLVADLIQASRADRVITMDLHADQIQGYFNVAVDHLKATALLAQYVEEHYLAGLSAEERRTQWVAVSPDAGAAKRAQTFAVALGLDLAVVLKQRRRNDDTSEIMHVIGEVKGRHCLIFDDEIDTAGTLVNTINSLCTDFGMQDAVAVVTHGILSGRSLKTIEEATALKSVVVTDTLDVPHVGETRHIRYQSGGQHLEEDINVTKIHECSVAGLFAATIRAIHLGESVTAVYDRWNVGKRKINIFGEDEP